MPEDYKPVRNNPFWSPQVKAGMARVNDEMGSRAATSAMVHSREKWAEGKREQSKIAVWLQDKATRDF